MSAPFNHEAAISILIADDHDPSRRLLSQMLKSEGYHIEEARDGREALEKYERNRPNAVLLDVMMPELDGFEVCQAIQAMPETRRVPVIMITALEDDASIDRAFEVGAADYITKPIRWTAVRHRLGRLLQAQQATEQLREERNLLYTLINNLPDYIFIKDGDGRFIVSNDAHAQAVRSTAENLIGKTAFDLWPAELALQYHTDDQTVIQSGKAELNLERVTVDAWGNRKPVLTTKVPLRNQYGKVTGLVGISRDITERKQAEESLRQLAEELVKNNEQLQELYNKVSTLEQLKSDMLRLASHDLRTPLTIIAGGAYLLRNELGMSASASTVERINEIEDAAKRIKKITDDILSVERIEASYNLEPISLDLADLTRIVFEENEPLARQKSQQYVVDLPDEPIPIQGVSSQLQEAMSNLVNNAIKYTPEGGKVNVRVIPDGSIATFEVTDTGYGIPEELQKWLFQPFYRARTAETEFIDGTGLGLHLVKKIIERHNGTIKVESTYGKGSVFTFQLPLSASA